ncbi:MAG: ABATE domain-containing protein [Candidatus Acidiferrales bacterium]
MSRPATNRAPRSGPIFLAGHLALDFLNTQMRLKGVLVDVFQRDQDVLDWLNQAGLPAASTGRGGANNSLLDSARALRENIRSLVQKRKGGRRGDPSLLNRFLFGAESHSRLVWNKSRALKVETVRRCHTHEAILGPVAEAAADLLANADFRFVKRCKDETCVLWFSDNTRSHHRRWCSMALCGNRHKVAAYRRRVRNDG